MTTSPSPRRVESPAVLLDDATARELYRRSGAEGWGVPEEAFAARLRAAVAARLRAGPLEDCSGFARSLHLNDLALACACAAGHEPAWEHFVRELRPALYAAARHVAPSAAEELANSLFAELFGLETRDGKRRSLLDYYHGRARLATWLRTVLVQRHVDSLRVRARLVQLDEQDDSGPMAAQAAVVLDPHRAAYVTFAQAALDEAVARLDDRTRLCLRLYYVEGLKLAQIGRLTHEHEATISRKLERARRDIRRHIDFVLQERHGLTPAAVTECLAAAAESPEMDALRLLGTEHRA